MLGVKRYKNTQEFVSVDEIKDGIVRTTDGRYLKIIELSPINFHLRSEEEKASIIYDFASWLKIAPVKMQFKVITCPANVDELIKSFQKDMADEKNEKCRELQKSDLEMIQDVSYRQGVTRRFFIVMQYESITSQFSSRADILFALNNAAQTAASFLLRCGNKVIPHNNEDLFLAELFYLLFNRSGSISLVSRVAAVAKDYANCERLGGLEPSLADNLAPRFAHIAPDYLVSNDTYFTFLYIPSDNYRISVASGWLAGIINAGQGFDIDIFMERQNKTKTRERLGRATRMNLSKLNGTQDTNGDFDTLSTAISSAYFIKNGLANNEEFYYMNVLITLSAPDLESLLAKQKWTWEILAAQDMRAKICKYHMVSSYLSTLPLCSLNKALYERSKRNVLTYGLASTYPFTAYELTDTTGIPLGINRQNNSMCIIDPFDTDKYKNANGCILGTTGAGKTFTLELMALRLRMRGIQTFIIAPLKGFEFYPACSAIGGSFIKLSPGSKSSINILEIRPIDRANDALIAGIDYGVDDESILSKKITKVHTFFSLIIPDMDRVDSQLVDNAIIEAYRKKGITHDNDSLVDSLKPKKNGMPQYKEMPILEDVYNELKAMSDQKANRLAIILDRYVHGSAQSFNAQTNVDLDNKYVVVDISEFSEELQVIGMFVALDYIYDKIKADRTQKKALFIDETWRLIGAKSNSYAASFVLEVFKIIRSYGGGAWAATQDMTDFFALDDGKYGKGIISNSRLKIVLQLETKEAESVQDVLELSDAEIRQIVRFERGNALVIANSNNFPLQVVSSDKELELITTDRKLLNEIAQKKKLSQNQ